MNSNQRHYVYFLLFFLLFLLLVFDFSEIAGVDEPDFEGETDCWIADGDGLEDFGFLIVSAEGSSLRPMEWFVNMRLRRTRVIRTSEDIHRRPPSFPSRR